MTEKFRALIVDDEALARANLAVLLNEDAEIETVGQCANGFEAIKALQQLRPDILFLDIQMPRLNGFEMLKRVEAASLPVIVFVTAYDKYALKAFEVNALDYLLKPFDDERFTLALQRAKEQVRQRRVNNYSQRLVNLLQSHEQPETTPEYLTRIVIKETGRVYFVRVEELDWIEASGSYAELHAGAKTHLLRESLNSLEQRLDPQRFLRIHRSTIVNLDRVQELQPYFRGEYVVLLRDGTRLKLSRTHRDKLQAILNQSL